MRSVRTTMPAPVIEPGLEHVGVFDVAPFGLEGRNRRDAPVPGAGIEDAPEERGTVEPGPAEPVDRSVPPDQSDGPAIANGGVVLDCVHRSIVP